MIQVKRFSTGGYVVHKITGNYKGRVSAWFDKDGNLLEAEQIIARRVRPVRRGGPMWMYTKNVGRLFRIDPK